MRVSERSWHLRFVRWVDEGAWFRGFLRSSADPRLLPYVPRDLCSYFWRVVGSFVLLLGITVFGGCIWAIGMTIFGAVALSLWVWRHTQPTVKWVRAQPKSPAAHEDGLLVAYVKAKKRRLCPRIEVVP